MMETQADFGRIAAKHCVQAAEPFQQDADDPLCVLAKNPTGQWMRLNLTPFVASPKPVTAAGFFDNVENVQGLVQAYRRARQSLLFEDDLPEAMNFVSDYAREFLASIVQHAKTAVTDHQARLIGQWVKHLDIYTAVKSVESLLYSKPDLALLDVAAEKGWTLHFDHLAIRCGTAERQDAQRVVRLLVEHHGYVQPQIGSEAFYSFPEGWNAYPLYKILENGQVLRLFIDQSDGSRPDQIIQHWNEVYGYTAHHLAIRATEAGERHRQAVDLFDLIHALQVKGVEVMKPTGEYTEGLLLQVFTKPQKVDDLPEALMDKIKRIAPALGDIITNGKLLELVSREEMPAALAEDFFRLYGIRYDPANPLQSAPYYQYFLPSQAAHVIKTSIEV